MEGAKIYDLAALKIRGRDKATRLNFPVEDYTDEKGNLQAHEHLDKIIAAQHFGSPDLLHAAAAAAAAAAAPVQPSATGLQPVQSVPSAEPSVGAQAALSLLGMDVQLPGGFTSDSMQLDRAMAAAAAAAGGMLAEPSFYSSEPAASAAAAPSGKSGRRRAAKTAKITGKAGKVEAAAVSPLLFGQALLPGSAAAQPPAAPGAAAAAAAAAPAGHGLPPAQLRQGLGLQSTLPASRTLSQLLVQLVSKQQQEEQRQQLLLQQQQVMLEQQQLILEQQQRQQMLLMQHRQAVLFEEQHRQGSQAPTDLQQQVPTASALEQQRQQQAALLAHTYLDPSAGENAMQMSQQLQQQQQRQGTDATAAATVAWGSSYTPMQTQSSAAAAAAQQQPQPSAAAAAAAAHQQQPQPGSSSTTIGSISCIDLDWLSQQLPAGSHIKQLMSGLSGGLWGIIYSMPSTQHGTAGVPAAAIDPAAAAAAAVRPDSRAGRPDSQAGRPEGQVFVVGLWDGEEWHDGGRYSNRSEAERVCAYVMNVAAGAISGAMAVR